MKMKRMRVVGLVGGVLLASVTSAKDLTWTGAVNTTWDKSTKNWSDGSTATAFSDSDNITISSGSAMTMDAAVSPGDVVFNLASDFTLTLSNNKKSITGVNSFEKRGVGNLTIASSYSQAGLAFYGPIDVKAGTLTLTGSNQYWAFSDFWHPAGTEYIVESGAKMVVTERNSIGQVAKLGGSAATIRVKEGGTLQFGPKLSGDHSANTVSNLYLEGGSLVFKSSGANGFGFIGVLDTVSFSGSTPYSVTSDSSFSYKGWSLAPGRPTRFDVADISGDENADVTMYLPFRRGASWTEGTKGVSSDMTYGFVKSGSGKMTINALADEANSPNGDVTVEGGVLEYTQQDHIRGEYAQTYTVKTNATLLFSLRNIIGGVTQSGGNVKTKIVIDHGSFVIDPSDGKAGHTYLGEELTLDHATFTTKMSGFGANDDQLGAFTLGRLLSFKGDKPYDFSPFAGMANPRVHLGADPVTEIRVADITGDAAVDVTNGYTLCDHCYMTNGLTTATPVPAGFIKTGAGTLALPVQGAYRGNVEVREGTVLLDKPNYAWGDFGSGAKSYLGDVTKTDRTITVATNGVLAFAQRNMLDSYTYGDDGGNTIQTKVVLKGGTLRFVGSNAANSFGSITVDGGSFDYSSSGDWSVFNFRGTFKVTGNTPLVLPQASEGKSFIPLYPLFACVFDIDDVTGDGCADFTSNLAITKPPTAAYYDGTKTNATTKLPYVYTYGFTKTGAGTMVLNAGGGKVPDFDDEARINAGTIMVNCNLAKAGTFKIASGAAVGGTGTVRAVTLADGAGFAAMAGQANGLTVAGNLAIPQTGTVRLTIPDGVEPEAVKVKVVKATGTMTGAANLAQWTIDANGSAELSSRFQLSVVNGEIRIGYKHGTVLLVR